MPLDLVREEISTTSVRPMDPASGVSFGTKLTISHDTATGAEIRNQQFIHAYTSDGLQSTESSRLHKCSCGRTVHFDATFLFFCEVCQRILCREHQAKLIAPGARPVTLAGKERQSDRVIGLDVGICRSDWDASRFRRMLLLVVAVLFTPVRWIWRALFATIGPGSALPPTPVLQSAQPQPSHPQSAPTNAATSALIIVAMGLSVATGDLPARTLQPTLIPVTGGMEMAHDKSVSQQQQTEALLDLAHKLGVDLPYVHPVGSTLCREIAYQLKTTEPDPGICAQLRRILDRRKEGINEHLLAFDQPGPSDGVGDGDLTLFTTLFTETPFNVFSGQVQRGLLAAGQTGFGKSTVLRRLAMAWVARNRPCVVFASKHDQFFWYLARLFPSRCLILRAGIDVFYNAFCPVTGDVKEFSGTKLTHYASAYSKWESAAVILRLFDEFDRVERPAGAVAPTINWLLRNLLTFQFNKRSLNFPLIPSTSQTLTMMKEGGLGKSMSCQRGITAKDIWEHKLVVVFDCAALSPADTLFLVTCLLADFRKVKGLCPDLTDLLCILDEAGDLMASSWNRDGHFNPLGSEWVLLRSADISTAAGVHAPSMMDARARTNTAISIVGGLLNSSDITAMAGAAGLTAKQTMAIPHLRPGWAIAKMTGERYSNAFLCTWPMTESFTPFSEAERIAQNARLLASLPPFVAEGDTGPKSAISSEPALPPLTPDQVAVLTDIVDRPAINTTTRAESIQLPSGKGGFKQLAEILNGLSDLKLIDEIKLQMSERGSPSTYRFLTNEGLAAIGRPNNQPRPGTGPAHLFVQQLVARLLKGRGIDAAVEPTRPGSGKQVDVGFNDPATGLWIALEVACTTHTSEPRQAIRDLSEGGWARVLVLGPTSSDIAALQHAFKKDMPDPDPRVTLILPHHLVTCPNLRSLYDCPELIPPNKQQRRT